jgi:hypothetical protein
VFMYDERHIHDAIHAFKMVASYIYSKLDANGRTRIRDVQIL